MLSGDFELKRLHIRPLLDHFSKIMSFKVEVGYNSGNTVLRYRENVNSLPAVALRRYSGFVATAERLTFCKP